MFSTCYIRLIAIAFFLTTLLPLSESKSLNVFELGLVGTGVTLAFNQYFDSSLNEKNRFRQQSDIISQYNFSRKINVSGSKFNNLPLQQQLIILESSKDY